MIKLSTDFTTSLLTRESKFVKELIALDSRIMLYPYFSGVIIGRGYLPSKTLIKIPAEIPRISHQIAHMVEIKTERCIFPDWGFEELTDDILKNNPFAKVARECRVLAIEKHIRPTCRDGVHLITNNFWWNTPVKEAIPFGRFKDIKDVENWAGLITENTFKRWNLDRVEEEWKSRLNYIANWMESK